MAQDLHAVHCQAVINLEVVSGCVLFHSNTVFHLNSLLIQMAHLVVFKNKSELF